MSCSMRNVEPPSSYWSDLMRMKDCSKFGTIRFHAQSFVEKPLTLIGITQCINFIFFDDDKIPFNYTLTNYEWDLLSYTYNMLLTCGCEMITKGASMQDLLHFLRGASVKRLAQQPTVLSPLLPLLITLFKHREANLNTYNIVKNKDTLSWGMIEPIVQTIAEWPFNSENLQHRLMAIVSNPMAIVQMSLLLTTHISTLKTYLNIDPVVLKVHFLSLLIDNPQFECIPEDAFVFFLQKNEPLLIIDAQLAVPNYRYVTNNLELDFLDIMGGEGSENEELGHQSSQMLEVVEEPSVSNDRMSNYLAADGPDNGIEKGATQEKSNGNGLNECIFCSIITNHDRLFVSLTEILHVLTTRQPVSNLFECDDSVYLYLEEDVTYLYKVVCNLIAEVTEANDIISSRTPCPHICKLEASHKIELGRNRMKELQGFCKSLEVAKAMLEKEVSTSGEHVKHLCKQYDLYDLNIQRLEHMKRHIQGQQMEIKRMAELLAPIKDHVITTVNKNLLITSAQQEAVKISKKNFETRHAAALALIKFNRGNTKKPELVKRPAAAAHLDDEVSNKRSRFSVGTTSNPITGSTSPSSPNNTESDETMEHLTTPADLDNAEFHHEEPLSTKNNKPVTESTPPSSPNNTESDETMERLTTTADLDNAEFHHEEPLSTKNDKPVTESTPPSVCPGFMFEE